jgi:hypothetical protein
MRTGMVLAAALAGLSLQGLAASDAPNVRALDVKAQTAVVADPATKQDTKLSRHQTIGVWTLMAVVEQAGSSMAVFENQQDRKSVV